VVIAPSPVEAVTFAGGWVFDRVMAGWDATVVTVGGTDFRALRILGSNSVDLERVLEAGGLIPKPHALAIDAGLCGSDARVRQMVETAVADGIDEVMLWSDCPPAGQVVGLGQVQHRLSVAALAFKAHALTAVDVEVESVDVAETFHRSELTHRSALFDWATS
jgi:hypothetical protein